MFAKLAEHQARNPAYSLRAFAKKLGVSPATISMIMNGRRSMSAKMAKKVCDALMLDPRTRAEVLAGFPDRSHYKLQRGEVIRPDYLDLNVDQFRLISEWHYFGILSLMRTRGFLSDPAWIARRLGVSARASDRIRRREVGALIPALSHH